MRTRAVVTESFAPPSEVAMAMVSTVADGSVFRAVWQTVSAGALGLLIGAGAGIILGLLIGLSPFLTKATRAPVELLRPLPSVALIPLALMTFGFGVSLEASIVAFATLWPTMIMAQYAVAGVDRQLLAVADALELTSFARLTKIVLPAALPRIIVALRLATGIALVVAVTVEITVNPRGIGYDLVIAQQSLRPALMLAFLVWIGILGWVLNQLVIVAERRLYLRLGQASGT
ncbi:ABC transporter permease [Mesorhizobium sp. 10J20-29]